jgi:hypothetical protein
VTLDFGTQTMQKSERDRDPVDSINHMFDERDRQLARVKRMKLLRIPAMVLLFLLVNGSFFALVYLLGLHTILDSSHGTWTMQVRCVFLAGLYMAYVFALTFGVIRLARALGWTWLVGDE